MYNKLMCGAAVENITPLPDHLPMPRDSSAEVRGIVSDSCVRAIALSCGGKKMLIVATETVSPPSPEKYVPLFSRRTGIPEEYILYTSTHSHATIVPERFKPDLDTPLGRRQQAYNEYAEQQILKAVDGAVGSMRPAKMGYALGESYINVNRNQDYVFMNEKGERSVQCSGGFNGAGPVDRTLVVVRFDDLEGNPIAFLLNYPCHAVVMHANLCCDGGMGSSGDYPGMVCSYMDEKFKGSVSLWTSGAAGDINPIMMNQMYYPDPATGKIVTENIADPNLLYLLSKRHFADILRTCEKITDMTEDADILVKIDRSVTPGRTVTAERPDDVRNPGALTYRDEGEFVVWLQLFKLGRLAILGSDGDIYTTIATHLKSLAPADDMIIVSHAKHEAKPRNSPAPSYVYDDDGIARQSIKYPVSGIKPGYVKDELSRVMLNMFKELS